MTSILLVGTLLIGSLLTPSPATAQPAGKKVPRVAVVSSGQPLAEMLGPDPIAPDYRAFIHTLRDRGWIDGQTVVIERRSAEGKYDQIPVIIADVVRQQPDVIMAVTNRVASAAKQATATIPIVATMGRAVENNLAASLARPGGNLTGIDVAEVAAINARRLQLLKETAPGLRRVAVLTTALGLTWFQEVQNLVKPLGLTLTLLDAEDDAKLDAALAAVAADPPSALMIPETPYLHGRRGRLVRFAAQHRLPSIGVWRELAAEGLLMAYGFNVNDLFRSGAVYVDRILRGAKPGDLPIEHPAKFDFVVNRKTARALGVTLPPAILVQATEVID